MPASLPVGRPMDVLQLANAAFVDEDYEGAVKLYNDYLAEHEGDATALAARSAALLKLNKYREALQDASTAAKLKADYEVAFYRKGLAAFSLSEFETAKAAFEKGAALLQASGKGDATRKYKTWIRKCDAELEDEEVQVPEEPPKAPAPKPASAPAMAPTAEVPVAKAAPPPMPDIRYQYYQTATHLTVTVLQKDVKQEDATIDIQPRKLSVRIRSAGGKEVVVLDKVLYDEVVVDECTTKFFATKVEIKLKKVSAYQWADLAGTEGGPSTKGPPPKLPPAPSSAAPPSSAAATAAPVIPRPYASSRNWDHVEKEIEKELEADKPEGEEALNKLFKDIYAKGSDETRRAMIKSFQTSGGTVLSTNWGEVAAKDYEKERTAPQGMEWKTWEGKKVDQAKEDDDT